MQPIQIDIVRLQPAQGSVKRVQNILSPISSSVGISRLASKSEFGGENRAVTVSALLQEFTDECLAGPVRVTVSRINEVVAGVEKLIEDLLGGVFGISPSPLGSECHGSQTKT